MEYDEEDDDDGCWMNDCILDEVKDDGANAAVPMAARVSAAAVLLGRGILSIFVHFATTLVKSTNTNAFLFLFAMNS